ncbi:MAG: dTMP kinase [Spirochaetaceae bacterium]|nr:MAG: dTMP kinase [Spirochaetaceae bacterium]
MAPASTRYIIDNFLVLEGLDGSGTTTQAARLASRLQTTGAPVLLTAEPTDGVIGRMIRDALHHRISLHPDTMAMLFAADRNEHVFSTDGIREQSRAGWVVSDRYLFSSLAYQSISSDPSLVYELNARFPLPELLIYLDVDPDECARRRAERGGEELYDAMETQRRVHANYRRILAEFSGQTGMRILEINGSRPVDEIAQCIWSEGGFAPI